MRFLAARALPVLLCLLPAACVTNPVTGHKQFMLVSEAEELQMGNEALPSIVYSYEHEYQDPELKRYLGTIVLRLHAVSHRANLPVDFRVLDTSLPNAFAIPGHVFVTRGLLVLLQNEGQFAAVMGHEMGHVAARHSAVGATRSMVAGLGMGLLGEALGRDLAGGAVLGFKLFTLHYGRSQEYQADKLGAYYAWRAGWDPQCAVEVQEILLKLGGSEPGLLSTLFSTHPPGRGRIRKLRKEIPDFGLSKADIQGDGRFAARWNRHLASLRKNHQIYRKYYDPARKLLSQGKTNQALSLLEQGIRLAPGLAPFHKLAGDALTALKRNSQAASAYRAAVRLDPKYVQPVFGLGRLAFRERAYSRAEGFFRECLAKFPEYTAAAYGLGLSFHRQGKWKEAVQPLVQAAKGGAGAPCLAVLGDCMDKLGRYDQALKLYRAVAEYAKKKPDAAKDPDVKRALKRIPALEKLVPKPKKTPQGTP